MDTYVVLSFRRGRHQSQKGSTGAVPRPKDAEMARNLRKESTACNLCTTTTNLHQKSDEDDLTPLLLHRSLSSTSLIRPFGFITLIKLVLFNVNFLMLLELATVCTAYVLR